MAQRLSGAAVQLGVKSEEEVRIATKLQTFTNNTISDEG